MERNKKKIKTDHIREFGGRNAPGASWGYNRDVWADLYGNSHSRGRTSAGQMGHMTGHKPGGVPPKCFMFIGFFPQSMGVVFALPSVQNLQDHLYLVNFDWFFPLSLGGSVNVRIRFF